MICSPLRGSQMWLPVGWQPLKPLVLKTCFQLSARLSFGKGMDYCNNPVHFEKGEWETLVIIPYNYQNLLSRNSQDSLPCTSGSSLVGQPDSSWFFLLNVSLHVLSPAAPGSASRGSFLPIFLNKYIWGGHRGDCPSWDHMNFKILGHRLFSSFNNHRLL